MYAARDSARRVERGLVVHRSFLVACLIVVRVIVVVLLSIEFSGLAHAALDGVEALSGLEQHAGQDCEEGEGHECPPGCPDCHCWHAGLPSTPVHIAASFTVVLRAVANLGFAPYHRSPPDAASSRSVYRPPRLAVARV